MKRFLHVFYLSLVVLAALSALNLWQASLHAGQVSAARNMSIGGTLPQHVCYGNFLPLVMYDPFAPTCSPATNYCEDYDTSTNPYGPLESLVVYSAFPEDNEDYYYFRLPEAATVVIQLTNFEPEIGWLVLYDSGVNELARDLVDIDNRMQIERYLEAGSYIIRVYTFLDNSPLLPYDLIVDYPLPSPPSNPPVLPSFYHRIYEDFEGLWPVNIWWTPEPDVFTTIITSTEVVKNGTQSLKVVFEKDDTYQYFAAELREDMHDLSQISVLDVWVYGEVDLLLKLEDGAGLQENVNVQSSVVSNTWNLLRFPLLGLSTVNLQDIRQLLFFPAPGDPTASGTFYLDDLLVRVNRGTLEDFEDTHNRLMIWWTPDEEDFIYYETAERACWLGRSLRVDYDKHTPYTYLAAEVPPGIRDFSWAQTLELRVHGVLYLMVKFEDEDGNEVELGALNTGSANNWTKLAFNYGNVGDEVDLTRIKNIRFFPYPGTIISGTMYFDNISIRP